jgi:hypothetical protein
MISFVFHIPYDSMYSWTGIIGQWWQRVHKEEQAAEFKPHCSEKQENLLKCGYEIKSCHANDSGRSWNIGVCNPQTH